MKIKLEYPFLEEFKSAYCHINKEPRRIVHLVRKDGTRTSMSYARFKMCIYKKRFLDKNEHVDHINNDKLDDRLENYQILSQAENTRKSSNRKWLKFICPICKCQAEKKFNNTHFNDPQKIVTSCSRSCGGILSQKSIEEKKIMLKEFEVIEVFYINSFDNSKVRTSLHS